MKHLDDGALRRMVDEPAAVRDRERDHVRGCATCRDRYAAIASDARQVNEWMGGASVVAADPAAALARLQRRIDAEGLQPRPHRWMSFGWSMRGRRKSLQVGIAATVAAVMVAGALAWTPAGSLAEDLVTVFQPSQPVAVTVTSGDLQTLSELSSYGTISMPAATDVQSVSGPEAATAASGMTVLTPGYLPADVSPSVRYSVVPSETASFIFSAQKASAAAAAKGETLPPMPANMDGSMLEVTTGNAVLATFGSQSQDLPNLVIGQMKRPVVTAKGVTVQQLEDYLLSLPGISPQLASDVRAIGDPTTALPIPVPVDVAYSHPATVQGVQGLVVGDSTGVGSGVVWQKDGIVYGVAGPISENEVLSIANGLHN
jgi:hypothetical protein